MRPKGGEKFPIGEMGQATMPLKSGGLDGLTSRTQAQTGVIAVWQGEVIFGAAATTGHRSHLCPTMSTYTKRTWPLGPGVVGLPCSGVPRPTGKSPFRKSL